MSEPTFTTRAQAAGPPAELVEIMAKGAYDRTRRGRSLPPWDQVTPAYAEATREEQRAALSAAVTAGYRIVGP